MTVALSWESFQQRMITHAMRLQGDSYPGDEYYLRDCWKEYFENGSSPESAVESDMECWKPDPEAA